MEGATALHHRVIRTSSVWLVEPTIQVSIPSGQTHRAAPFPGTRALLQISSMYQPGGPDGSAGSAQELSLKPSMSTGFSLFSPQKHELLSACSGAEEGGLSAEATCPSSNQRV